MLLKLWQVHSCQIVLPAELVLNRVRGTDVNGVFRGRGRGRGEVLYKAPHGPSWNALGFAIPNLCTLVKH
jgi:hypothetical protein